MDVLQALKEIDTFIKALVYENKASKSEIPIKASVLVNDFGFITYSLVLVLIINRVKSH